MRIHYASPTYNIFQININPSRISHIYIHTEGPSASYIASLALSDVPQRVKRDSAPRSGCPVYLAFTLLNPIMINTRIQQKSVPIIAYIHLQGPFASLLTL